MPNAKHHSVVHEPTGLVAASSLSEQEANAACYALASQDRDSRLAEDASGNRKARKAAALRRIRRIVDDAVSAARRANVAAHAERGTLTPRIARSAGQPSTAEAEDRIRTALEALSDRSWVVERSAGTIVVRPPKKRSANAGEDAAFLGEAFKIQPKGGKVVISSRRRAFCVASVEENAIPIARRVGVGTSIEEARAQTRQAMEQKRRRNGG